MKRRTFCSALAVGASRLSYAQPALRKARIGFLDLRATKALGIAIPQALLLRVDEVIQ